LEEAVELWQERLRSECIEMKEKDEKMYGNMKHKKKQGFGK
jgi:hypothetical protein